MKKLIQEFRIALQFGVKRKDDSMQELRKAYDNQCKLIHEFFEQFDYIEKQEVESQNLSACICFCSGNEHDEQEIKRQYQQKIDELEKSFGLGLILNNYIVGLFEFSCIDNERTFYISQDGWKRIQLLDFSRDWIEFASYKMYLKDCKITINSYPIKIKWVKP